MKRPALRDIPPYAAAAIVAMVLLASLVSGREQSSLPEVRHSSSNRPHAASEPLDLEKLVRQSSQQTAVDLFSAPVVIPPPAPPPPPMPRREEPPSVPAAPQLPFAYTGRILKGEHYYAYLLRKDEMLVAEAGEMLGDDYRVEGITDDAIHLLYVPLGLKQVLPIPQNQ